MVRQHLLRGTIATEVESVILRASEQKNSKNYVFEEHYGHAAQNELARDAQRRK